MGLAVFLPATAAQVHCLAQDLSGRLVPQADHPNSAIDCVGSSHV